MLLVFYPIGFLLLTPVVYGAPTIRPRQFPTDITFPDFTGFDTSFPDFTGFDTKLPSFTGFDTSFPDFTGFDTKLPSFTGFDTHWPTGFPTMPGDQPPPTTTTTRPTTRSTPVDESRTFADSTPNNSQDSHPSTPTSSLQSQGLYPSGTTDTVHYDPFESFNKTPPLTFGAILGIAFGGIGGFTLLFVLYYLYRQHNKKARSLERQLAFNASNNNTNNNQGHGNQQRQQNITTTAATSTSSPQQTEFYYGADYQPYRPYQEQPSSPQSQPPSYPEPMYATHHTQQQQLQQEQNDAYHHQPIFPMPAMTATPGQPTFETYPMASRLDQTRRHSTTQLDVGDDHWPAPPYENLAPKPDAVASPMPLADMLPNTNTPDASSSSSSSTNRLYHNDITADKPHSKN